MARGHGDARRPLGERRTAVWALGERLVPLALVAPQEDADRNEIEEENVTRDRDRGPVWEMRVRPAQEHDLRDAENDAQGRKQQAFAALHAANPGSLANEFLARVGTRAGRAGSGDQGIH